MLECLWSLSLNEQIVGELKTDSLFITSLNALSKETSDESSNKPARPEHTFRTRKKSPRAKSDQREQVDMAQVVDGLLWALIKGRRE